MTIHSDDERKLILPPKNGHRDKVVLTCTHPISILTLCQREGGTRVVPGLSAQLVA